MIFDKMRVEKLDYIIHHTPKIMKFSAKSRKNHIIGIQISGKGAHYFQDGTLILEENCIYFLNQEENYDAEIIRKGLAFSVHFTSFFPVDTKSFSIKISNPNNIVKLLERIENKFNSSSGTNSSVLSDMYSLFSLYEDIYTKKYSKLDERWTEAARYINLYFKEADCVKKASETYGVSLRRFNDIFKKNYNTTPNKYITGLKIELSKKLLLEEGYSVTDVAFACGFSDVYYFSKVFKKEMGITPSEYKKGAAAN